MHAANTWGMIWSLLCDILIFSSSEFVENCHDMSFCHVTVNMLKEKIYIYFYLPTLWIIFTPISDWMSPLKQPPPYTPLLNQLTVMSDIVDLLKQVLIKKIKAPPTNQEQSSQPP